MEEDSDRIEEEVPREVRRQNPFPQNLDLPGRGGPV